MIKYFWVVLRGDWIARLFYALYLSVAVATFRHSAHGFASIEGGSFWWGALSALAVDAGMMLSASGLRRARGWPLVTGLIVSAVASTYTQLLYSVFSAAQVSVAPGAEWLGDWARYIVDARVLALPALLPLLSVVYAFAAKGPSRDGTPPDFDARVAEILARIPGKETRAREIWALERNGAGELSVEEVAQLAGCHPATARKARPPRGGL